MVSVEELSNIPIVSPLSSVQERYINDESQIVVVGGAASSGKTQSILYKTLFCALNDPNYRAGILSYSKEMMRGAGSIIDSAKQTYIPLGGKENKVNLTFEFPNGAYVKFNQLNNNKRTFYSQQATHFLVDEGQLCTEDDVWFLTSRLRSRSKYPTQLIISCNPNSRSFLRKWLDEHYLDEMGYPIEEMSGVVTYLVQVAGQIKIFKSREEIEEKHGKDLAKYAQSFVFYSANVMQNPWMRLNQPEYVSRLHNLGRVDKARLLWGNWHIDEEGQGYLKKSMFEEVNLADIPIEALDTQVRAYDLAGSEPNESNRFDPDRTRGVKACFDRDTQTLYILDVLTVIDKSAIVEKEIIRTAYEDGKGVVLGLPIDPGMTGREVYQQKSARLMQLGFKVIGNKTTQSKLKRAEEMILAAQAGRIKVVKGVLEDSDWEEMEHFTGQRNKRGQHDDLVDGLADCWNMLQKGFIQPIKINDDKGTMQRMKMLRGRTLLK